ncbi:hypothetical protein AB6G03_20815, partial [Providencia hangzhouensis]|uniref:hypothetical protein n=1 Tax=Providencia hangzhouensis TaxID=3031799 RepID=UPI0034DD2520
KQSAGKTPERQFKIWFLLNCEQSCCLQHDCEELNKRSALVLLFVLLSFIIFTFKGYFLPYKSTT